MTESQDRYYYEIDEEVQGIMILDKECPDWVVIPNHLNWEYEKYQIDKLVCELNEQEYKIQELKKENEQLKWSKKILRANKKDCELGRKHEREQWLKMDNMRIERIQFLQKRLKRNGLSIYINDGDEND